MATSVNEKSKITKLTDEFKKSIQSKGEIKEWTDAFLIKFRDKMRLVARSTRGSWSFDFYETLQEINKESIKRDLPMQTK